MTKSIITLLFLFLLSFQLPAQVMTPAPDRANDPVQEYPITNVKYADALAEWAANFETRNVGFQHVYVDPDIDPKETYLMEGIALSSTSSALLPRKFQRLAARMNAKLYGVAAVRGVGESLYIVRMDGDRSDRIEMFALRNGKVEHLKTLAYRSCTEGQCSQLDSYLTDVDGDTELDLIQIARKTTKSGEKASKPKAFVLTENGKKWKKTKRLDLPLTSLEFYEAGRDQ